MIKRLNFLHLLSSNGWIWDAQHEETGAGCRFNMTVLGDSYHYTISAIVSEYEEHLKLSGHYGVQWLEMVGRPDASDEVGMTIDDMFDAMSAIVNAENNLVRIGVPFVPSYRFHSSKYLHHDVKKKMNEECRNSYGLSNNEDVHDDVMPGKPEEAEEAEEDET